MKIIQISDLHMTPPGQLLFGADPAQRLMACIQHINRHHADADLCVLTGDLTHAGHPLAYERLAQCLEHLIPETRFLMGNHDERRAFGSYFPKALTTLAGFYQFSEVMGQHVCIYLDSLEQGYTNGYLCPTRLQWLEKELRATSLPVLLFSHHPLPQLQYPSMDWLRLRNADSVHELLKRHQAGVHLFAGHVHRCAAGTWKGIPFSTVNGTNHQHELDLMHQGAATSTFEPASYALILPHQEGVTVHFQPYDYPEMRFPYQGDIGLLKCV